jgi:DNA-directed RNA polymerase specialized sigma24 family protein
MEEKKVFDEYYHQIYLFVAKTINDKEKISDIVVKTFQIFFEKKYNNIENNSIRTNLYIIARQKCYTYLKQLSKITEQQQKFLDNYFITDTTNDELDGEYLKYFFKNNKHKKD